MDDVTKLCFEFVGRHSTGLGATKETGVDGVDDRFGGNGTASEEATVQAVESFLARLDTVKLDIHVTVVLVGGNMEDVAVFLFAFSTNVSLKSDLPVFSIASFPVVRILVKWNGAECIE